MNWCENVKDDFLFTSREKIKSNKNSSYAYSDYNYTILQLGPANLILVSTQREF